MGKDEGELHLKSKAGLGAFYNNETVDITFLFDTSINLLLFSEDPPRSLILHKEKQLKTIRNWLCLIAKKLWGVNSQMWFRDKWKALPFEQLDFLSKSQFIMST